MRLLGLHSNGLLHLYALSSRPSLNGKPTTVYDRYNSVRFEKTLQLSERQLPMQAANSVLMSLSSNEAIALSLA